MTWASWLLVGIAALLPLRRLLEAFFLGQSMARLRYQRGAAQSTAACEIPYLVVLLPLLDEQSMVEPLLDHFTTLECCSERTQFVIITTEKERSDSRHGWSTRSLVERAMKARRLDDDRRWQHLHFPRVHAFRADQLNFAVAEVAGRVPPQETYIGVYNADSRPDCDTLQLLADDARAEHGRTGEFPHGYQQPAVYVVPQRYRNPSSLLHAAAAFQTVYTIAHLLRRLFLAARRPAAAAQELAGATPVQFLGHGEFVRLDVLMHVGLFPTFAYADGLLLGWLLALHGHPIRVLPTFDHAEMPPSTRALVRQHKAWFTGLLNLSAAVRARYARERPAARRTLIAFCVRRMAATIGWGLRGSALAMLLMAGALSGWGTFLLTSLAVAVYAIAPLTSVSRFPELSTSPRGVPPSTGGQLARRMAASIPALFIDGFGFWPALAFRLRTRANQAVPSKTERDNSETQFR